MPIVLTFLVVIACIQAYRVPHITIPLDSDIKVLRWSDISFKVAHGHPTICGDPITDNEASKLDLIQHKKVLLNWEAKEETQKGNLSFPLELPNTAIVKTINNIAAFPVLSIDYGSRFIGLSIHHMGKSETLRGILNSGNVDHLCECIYSIVKQRINPSTRYIVLVGLPFSRNKLTEGKCLFQTLYNLDFATRLSRYIHERYLEVYGNWEHLLKDKIPKKTYSDIESRCLACSLGLGWCSYNRECSEIFSLEPSDYGSATVLGISEEFSSYQTEIFRGENNVRKDSLASGLIFRNLIEAVHGRHIHRMPFLLLPSNNNIFRCHTKGECLLFYKTLCTKILSRAK